MGEPKNLCVMLPDYCNSCTKGELDLETTRIFMDGKATTVYRVVCAHEVICALWYKKENQNG